MGLNTYEYPQVPRSTQSQISEAAPQQTSQSTHNRFSWVETPAEAKAYTWQRNGNVERQPEMPPLPQLPEHLHNSQGLPAGSNTVSRADEQSSQPTAYQYQSPIPQQPAPAYSQSEPPPAQQYPYPSGPTSDHRQDSQTYHHQPSQQPLTQPQYQERQSSQDSKLENTMQYTQMPSQPAHRDPAPRETFTISPDENPLSPTTPTKQQLPTTAANTTNIPVIRPSDPVPGLTTSTTFSPTPHPVHGGTWLHSLCSCAMPAICITSLFCPCITYGRTQYRLSQRSAHKDPTNMLGYSTCNGSCVAFGVLCGVNAILAAIQKTRVRKAYEMDRAQAGGVVDDLLKGACCCCCSVAQDEKEVRWREEEGRRVGGGAAGRSSKEGYAPVGGMTFSPPPPRDG